uniref:hypothetical protein n=1 Tax=Pigmentiphaga litoralis TaxID=516702 RepID=UPI0038998D2C
MGLRDLLARAAASRCHVFLAEMPGAALARMEAERELGLRGWVQALSPAAADVLCVCGDAPEALREPLERLWEQLPGPRARVVVTADGEGVPRAFDAALRELLDTGLQDEDARHRPVEPAPPDDGADMGHGDMDHGQTDPGGGGMDMDHGQTDPGGGGMDMDHGQTDPGGGGMDHGDMDMPMPGGIPLAGGGPDRDGLDLDVLTLRLGPILPFWPPGVTLACRLQGDLVVEAAAEPPHGQPAHVDGVPPQEARAVVLHQLDRALTVLRLAGPTAAAARVRRVRDAVLGARRCRRAAARSRTSWRGWAARSFCAGRCGAWGRSRPARRARAPAPMPGTGWSAGSGQPPKRPPAVSPRRLRPVPWLRAWACSRTSPWARTSPRCA